MSLRDHATLKGLSGLQLLPAVDGTNLHADEPLVRIFRPEISGGLGLLDPRVPHNGVFKVVANDIEERLAILEHGGSILLDGLVDAVGLASDGDRWVGLGVLGSVEDLVDVVCGAEAVDLELGDVLAVFVRERIC